MDRKTDGKRQGNLMRGIEIEEQEIRETKTDIMLKKAYRQRD